MPLLETHFVRGCDHVVQEHTHTTPPTRKLSKLLVISANACNLRCLGKSPLSMIIWEIHSKMHSPFIVYRRSINVRNVSSRWNFLLFFIYTNECRD